MLVWCLIMLSWWRGRVGSPHSPRHCYLLLLTISHCSLPLSASPPPRLHLPPRMPPCVPACQLVRNLACSPALLPTCVAAYLPDCLPFVLRSLPLSLASVCQGHAILTLRAPLTWPLRRRFNVFLCFVNAKPGANAIPMSACWENVPQAFSTCNTFAYDNTYFLNIKHGLRTPE